MKAVPQFSNEMKIWKLITDYPEGFKNCMYCGVRTFKTSKLYFCKNTKKLSCEICDPSPRCEDMEKEHEHFNISVIEGLPNG